MTGPMIFDAVASISAISREKWSNLIIVLTLLFLAAKIWALTKSIRELEATISEIRDDASTTDDDLLTDGDPTSENVTIKSEQTASSEIMDDPFISENVTLQRRLDALNREVVMRAAMDLRKKTAMSRAVRILKDAGRERNREAGGVIGLRGR